MIDLIKEVLQSPAGSFGFILSLLLLSGWLIYFVTKKVTEITSDHGSLKKSIDKMDNEIYTIRTELAYIKGCIISKDGKALMQSRSPLSMTDAGVQVSKEIEAESIKV